MLTQLIEKRHEFDMPSYFAFIDYEKVFDRVDTGQLWKNTEKKRNSITSYKSCPKTMLKQ